jgi:hypothetical protein
MSSSNPIEANDSILSTPNVESSISAPPAVTPSQMSQLSSEFINAYSSISNNLFNQQLPNDNVNENIANIPSSTPASASQITSTTMPQDTPLPSSNSLNQILLNLQQEFINYNNPFFIKMTTLCHVSLPYT